MAKPTGERKIHVPGAYTNIAEANPLTRGVARHIPIESADGIIPEEIASAMIRYRMQTHTGRGKNAISKALDKDFTDAGKFLSNIEAALRGLNTLSNVQLTTPASYVYSADTGGFQVVSALGGLRREKYESTAAQAALKRLQSKPLISGLQFNVVGLDGKTASLNLPNLLDNIRGLSTHGAQYTKRMALSVGGEQRLVSASELYERAIENVFTGGKVNVFSSKHGAFIPAEDVGKLGGRFSRSVASANAGNAYGLASALKRSVSEINKLFVYQDTETLWRQSHFGPMGAGHDPFRGPGTYLTSNTIVAPAVSRAGQFSTLGGRGLHNKVKQLYSDEYRERLVGAISNISKSADVLGAKLVVRPELTKAGKLIGAGELMVLPTGKEIVPLFPLHKDYHTAMQSIDVPEVTPWRNKGSRINRKALRGRELVGESNFGWKNKNAQKEVAMRVFHTIDDTSNLLGSNEEILYLSKDAPSYLKTAPNTNDQIAAFGQGQGVFVDGKKYSIKRTGTTLHAVTDALPGKAIHTKIHGVMRTHMKPGSINQFMAMEGYITRSIVEGNGNKKRRALIKSYNDTVGAATNRRLVYTKNKAIEITTGASGLKTDFSEIGKAISTFKGIYQNTTKQQLFQTYKLIVNGQQHNVTGFVAHASVTSRRQNPGMFHRRYKGLGVGASRKSLVFQNQGFIVNESRIKELGLRSGFEDLQSIYRQTLAEYGPKQRLAHLGLAYGGDVQKKLLSKFDLSEFYDEMPIEKFLADYQNDIKIIRAGALGFAEQGVSGVGALNETALTTNLMRRLVTNEKGIMLTGADGAKHYIAPILATSTISVGGPNAEIKQVAKLFDNDVWALRTAADKSNASEIASAFSGYATTFSTKLGFKSKNFAKSLFEAKIGFQVRSGLSDYTPGTGFSKNLEDEAFKFIDGIGKSNNITNGKAADNLRKLFADAKAGREEVVMMGGGDLKSMIKTRAQRMAGKAGDVDTIAKRLYGEYLDTGYVHGLFSADPHISHLQDTPVKVVFYRQTKTTGNSIYAAFRTLLASFRDTDQDAAAVLLGGPGENRLERALKSAYDDSSSAVSRTVRYNREGDIIRSAYAKVSGGTESVLTNFKGAQTPLASSASGDTDSLIKSVVRKLQEEGKVLIGEVNTQRVAWTNQAYSLKDKLIAGGLDAHAARMRSSNALNALTMFEQAVISFKHDTAFNKMLEAAHNMGSGNAGGGKLVTEQMFNDDIMRHVDKQFSKHGMSEMLEEQMLLVKYMGEKKIDSRYKAIEAMINDSDQATRTVGSKLKTATMDLFEDMSSVMLDVRSGAASTGEQVLLAGARNIRNAGKLDDEAVVGVLSQLYEHMEVKKITPQQIVDLAEGELADMAKASGGGPIARRTAAASEGLFKGAGKWKNALLVGGAAIAGAYVYGQFAGDEQSILPENSRRMGARPMNPAQMHNQGQAVTIMPQERVYSKATPRYLRSGSVNYPTSDLNDSSSVNVIGRTPSDAQVAMTQSRVQNSRWY